MTDIVERLRDKRLMIDRQLREEAADEIENYRAALQLANSNVAEAVHQLNEAESEIERLRNTKLEEAAALIHDRAVHIRNAALEEAAQVAYRLYATTNGIGIAAAIRALKDQ